MTDLFSLLGQPRSPWLDPDDVKEAFVTAAAELHPDRVHEAPADVRREAQERYSLLNEAHLCLMNVRTRLRHLLELERGTKVRDLQEIPDDLMDLFERLGEQLRAADRHCRENAQAGSPLLRVALFARGEELRETLQETQTVLQQRMHGLEDAVRSLSQHWAQAQADDSAERNRLLAELETLYRLISFHDRWQNQVRARMLQLMEQAP